MSEFVDTPMPGEFVKEVRKGGPGTYDGDDCPVFDGWHRTPSPNGVPEKIFDKSKPLPEGEYDQY